MIYINNISILPYLINTNAEEIWKAYTDIYLLEGQLSFKRSEKRCLAAIKLQDISQSSWYRGQHIQTNKSYSGDITALAISNQKIGIDIETIVYDFDYQEISKAIFSQAEIEHLRPFTPLKFFTSWTRKEAILKSVNSGIINEFQLIPSIDGDHNFPCLCIFNAAEDIYVYSFIHKNNVISVSSSNKQKYIRIVIL